MRPSDEAYLADASSPIDPRSIRQGVIAPQHDSTTICKGSRTMNKYLAILMAGTALAASSAHAYVTADVVKLTPADAIYSPGTFHLSFGSRPADVLVNFDAGMMNYVAQTLDVTNYFLLAHPGDVLTADTFAHGVPAAQDPYSNPTAGLDFYLAGKVVTTYLDPGEPFVIATDHSSNALPGWPYDVRFGWAHIHINLDGTAQVLASAMAYGEGGIIVGTVQAVPEPASLALAFIGLGLVGAARLRQARPPKTML